MTHRICKVLASHSLQTSKSLSNPSFATHSIYFTSFSTCESQNSRARITIYDYLVKHHNFSPESASQIPCSTTKYIRNPLCADSVFSFLKTNGFSNRHLEKVFNRYPQILSANLEKKIGPKIRIFLDLGLSPVETADIFSADPNIFNISTSNRLQRAILVLKSVLGSDAGVSKLLKLSRWFLFHDLNKTLIPNIEFLKSCGISSPYIYKCIFHFPQFCLMKPESLKNCLKMVNVMGFNMESNMLILAIRVVSSMNRTSWEQKLRLFRELGFSEEDTLSAFRRMPLAFGVSERKIKEIAQLFSRSRNFGINHIIKQPELLLYSVEQRLKPRIAVMEALESKNLLPKIPSSSTTFIISNKKFLQRFVVPYSDEVGNLYRSSLSS